MKDNSTLRQSLSLLSVSILCYILMHYIFDLGDFPLFKGNIGPKNFLPATMGLLLGPFGAAGVFIGAICAGALTGASVPVIASEAVGALVMSGGGWLLWYSGSGKRAIAQKNMRDLLRFISISAALSCVCAAAAMLSGASPFVTFGSYMAWNILLGIPVIIIMTSIFCINIVYPPWCPLLLDINEKLILEPECIAVVSDKIDELCFTNKLDRKRGFQMQSCIEECILLILSEPTCKRLLLTVRISDSISIIMRYDGKPCNPLRSRTEEDQIGLTLIKQRALRAYHRYSGGTNNLHIVQ